VRALSLTYFLAIALSVGLIARSSDTAKPSDQNDVSILSSFDSDSGTPEMTYKDHPDLAMGACSKCGGSGQVLVVTGQDVAVHDTTGKLLKKQTMRQFLLDAGLDLDVWKSRPALPPRAAGKIDDPRAAYDPFIRRWIVVCSCSADFLVVSAGDDATQSWKGVVLTGFAGDITMFPGWDKNGVYISEFEEKLNSRVIALPSADVAWRGNDNISLAHKTVFDQRAYEMRPALDPNPKKRATDPEYLVARTGPPQAATNFKMDLLVDKIAWSGDEASISGPTVIPTGFLYNTPIPASQPSGLPIRGNESHRVFGVTAHGDRLNVVEASGPCATDCGEQGVDTNNIFYWFQIDPSTATLTQKIKISDPSLSLVFPTLAVDARGNVGIGLTGISSTQSPSVYLYAHRSSDGAAKMIGPILAHAGTGSYSCDKGPRPNDVGWGTYSATVQDGSDPMKLWTLQEYAGSSVPCEWKTRVIAFEVGAARTKPGKAPAKSKD
jgi:hypothetical protein